MAEAVGCAVVGARLHYATSVLHSISQCNIDILQHVQNLLVRIVTATARRRSTVTNQELLIQLHWPPIKHQIQYKLAILAKRSPSSTASLYSCSLISRISRILRSSSDRFYYMCRAINYQLPAQVSVLLRHHLECFAY
jgi:hypothetical protein